MINTDPMAEAHENRRRILVVDDDADIRRLVQEILSENGYDVDLAANVAEARASRARYAPDLVLLDVRLPGTDGIELLRQWSHGTDALVCPIVMISAHGTVRAAVDATHLGAIDFLEKPFSYDTLLNTVERTLTGSHDVMRHTAALLQPPIAPVCRSRAIQLVREKAARIAAHEVPALLTGEPGTGRAAFARYIHALSSRAAHPFVAVSAAILTEDAALPFLHGRQAVDGHEPGQYEQAGRGTLFISDLEDLPPATQHLLLRDLRSGQYVASDQACIRSLDFRFVCSAQPGFAAAGSEHPFDQDLLSLLSAVTLRIPPLREYSEDVPDLLSHYVDRLADEFGLPYRRFSVAAQNRLRNYEWPGNLGELQGFVRKLLILGDQEEIGLEEVERELSGPDPIETATLKMDLLTLPLREAREEFERAYVRQQLLICNAKVDEFAKRVGMETTRAYSKLRSLGLAMPLREARQQFERAYLRRQLMNCNGKVEQLAKRAGMERTHVYRKLHALGVDFQNEDGAPHSGLMGRNTSDSDRV